MKIPFLLSASMVALASVMAGQVEAQNFTTLYNFTGGSDGNGPLAGLILSGNTLYGTASGDGIGGFGTVFAVNTDSTGFTTLHSFTGGTGGYRPTGGLVLSSNTLYGTAYYGGSGGAGTVFAVNTNGTGFTNLHSFVYATDGGEPDAGLILSDKTLYGTAYRGGIAGGTVFGLSLGSVTPPQLTIIPAGANLMLSWPTSATGFTLQSTTNLSSPVWTTNLPAPAVVNGQYTVINPIAGNNQFFRLSR